MGLFTRRHSKLTAENIHTVVRWEVADTAARLVLQLGSDDDGKVCKQLDNSSYWVLEDYSGPTWIEFTSVGVAAVTSVFGQIGDVDETDASFTAADIANVPAGTVVAVNVQAAIDELDAEKTPLTHTHVLSQVLDAGTSASEDVGVTVGDVPQLEDVGGGTPGMPAVDGSQLTGIDSGGSAITVEDDGTPLTTDVTLLNFAGAGVTISEPVADEITVTIAPGAAPIDTVFGRTGAVVAVADDYTASEVTNAPSGDIAATDVQAAIDELDADKAATGDARFPTTDEKGALAGTGAPSGSNRYVVDDDTRVVSSAAHAAGDGSDHADVATNTSDIATLAASKNANMNFGVGAWQWQDGALGAVGSGEFSTNSAVPSAVTVLKIYYNGLYNTGSYSMFTDIQVGDRLFFSCPDSTIIGGEPPTVTYEVSSASVDTSGTFTIPVSYDSGNGGGFESTLHYGVNILRAEGGGGGGPVSASEVTNDSTVAGAFVDDALDTLKTAGDLNTTHSSSDGSDHSDVVTNSAAVAALGTAANEDVGVGVDDVVQLINTGIQAGLPAVDGSLLTDVDWHEFVYKGVNDGITADPGTGNWKRNTADTRLEISASAANGLGMSSVLNALSSGSHVYWNAEGATRVYAVASIADETTHFDVTVTLQSSSTGFALTSDLLYAFLPVGGGGGGGGGDITEVAAGDGLTGGATSGIATLDVVAHADGSIAVTADDVQVGVLATDVQHGARGGGTQHQNAIAAGASGFMTGADKTKLDSIESAAKDDQTITAGAGLTGGGTGDPTLTVGQGTGVIVNADDVEVNYGATVGTATEGNDTRLVDVSHGQWAKGASAITGLAAAGEFDTDSAAISTTTQIRWNDSPTTGVADSTPMLLGLGPLDHIYLQDVNDATVNALFLVDSADDVSGQQTLDVTYVDRTGSDTWGTDYALHPVKPASGFLVDETGKQVDDFLSWDGTAWIPVSGGTTDVAAIHDNESGEISAITAKGAPVAADFLLIEDSAAADAKKSITIGDINHNLLTNYVAAQHVDWAGAGAGTIHTDNYIEGGDGTDGTAIHDNVASEISALTDKASPVGADFLIIEDSEAANVKKRISITNLPTGSDTDAIHDNVASEISAITAKATPTSADFLIIEDAADTNNKKSITLGDLPGAGASSHGFGEWSYDTTVTAYPGADPGSGNFALDNAAIGSATYLYLDDLDLGGVNASTQLDKMWDVGDFIKITKTGDNTVAHLLELEGPVIDEGGYYSIRVDERDGGTGTMVSTDNMSFTHIARSNGERTIVHAQKASAGTINPDQLVYISDYNISNLYVEVELADASTAATMPMLGVCLTTITDTTTGKVLVQGILRDQTTTGTTVGDPLYVSDTAGDFSTTPGTVPQQIGTVARVSASTGVINLNGNNITEDLADNSVTPAKITTQSDSGAFIFNASGVPAYLGPGVAGTVLTSGGTGVIPAWTAGTAPVLSKTVTVEDPVTSEDISIFFTNTAITVTEMRAVVRGTTPSVLWFIKHGTDRSAAGAAVVTAGTTTTSQSTGSDVTSFDDATIVADSFVWLETTTVSGTNDEISITIVYTED